MVDKIDTFYKQLNQLSRFYSTSQSNFEVLQFYNLCLSIFMSNHYSAYLFRTGLLLFAGRIRSGGVGGGGGGGRAAVRPSGGFAFYGLD